MHNHVNYTINIHVHVLAIWLLQHIFIIINIYEYELLSGHECNWYRVIMQTCTLSQGMVRDTPTVLRMARNIRCSSHQQVSYKVLAIFRNMLRWSFVSQRPYGSPELKELEYK